MKSAWRITLLIVLASILVIIPFCAAFTIKPVNLPSPGGFTRGCHPSYDEFIASTIAADFTSDRTQGDAPFRVKFYDVSYGYADKRLWDFGDGNTSTERNPSHTYRDPGSYDVSLTIYSDYQYETPMTEYLNTTKGQFTDITWQSTERKLNYITTHERGSGIRQEVPDGWYPEPTNRVTLPSGVQGAVGSASFKMNEITLYNSSMGYLTERGYQESLDVSGAYYLVKSVPYNTAF